MSSSEEKPCFCDILLDMPILGELSPTRTVKVMPSASAKALFASTIMFDIPCSNCGMVTITQASIEAVKRFIQDPMGSGDLRAGLNELLSSLFRDPSICNGTCSQK